MVTGAVQDYALLLQILIAVGLLLLAFPVDSWTEILLLQGGGLSRMSHVHLC